MPSNEPTIEWRAGVTDSFIAPVPPYFWRKHNVRRKLHTMVLCSNGRVKWALVDITFDPSTPQEERERHMQTLLDLCNLRFGGCDV